MKSSIQKARRFFLSRLLPKYSQALLREIEETHQAKAEAARLQLEVSALRVSLSNERSIKAAIHRESQELRLNLELTTDRADAWEQTANEAITKLNEQAALNADLLQQGFGVSAEMVKHSRSVDAFKFQVLTQFTARNLILKPNLLSALHDAFSLNVARHILKKLVSGGHARADDPMSESEYRALCRGDHPAINKKPAQLPPSSR